MKKLIMIMLILSVLSCYPETSIVHKYELAFAWEYDQETERITSASPYMVKGKHLTWTEPTFYDIEDDNGDVRRYYSTFTVNNEEIPDILAIPKEDSLMIAGLHIKGKFNVIQDAISISMANPDGTPKQLFLIYRELIDNQTTSKF